VARRKKRHRTVSRPAQATAEARLAAIRDEQAQHEQALAHLVAAAAIAGATGDAIARTLGVSRATVYRRFGDALRAGRNASVGI
jgi:AcrR family transcriptional regulator